jgi:predicted transcriptional regulator
MDLLSTKQLYIVRFLSKQRLLRGTELSISRNIKCEKLIVKNLLTQLKDIGIVSYCNTSRVYTMTDKGRRLSETLPKIALEDTIGVHALELETVEAKPRKIKNYDKKLNLLSRLMELLDYDDSEMVKSIKKDLKSLHIKSDT